MHVSQAGLPMVNLCCKRVSHSFPDVQCLLLSAMLCQECQSCQKANTLTNAETCDVNYDRQSDNLSHLLVCHRQRNIEYLELCIEKQRATLTASTR